MGDLATIDFTALVKAGNKYEVAMQISTQAAADAYFKLCVQDCMSAGVSREEAENIERQNIGYYAGYYSNETRARVEKLFKCAHPVFGAIAEVGAPTPEQAFKMGVEMAERKLKKK